MHAEYLFDTLRRMADKIELGEFGRTVAARIAKYRTQRGMTYADLSKKLEFYEWKIPPLGLRRIEAMERRVSVDDLMMIAICLGTSLPSLMVPDSWKERDAAAFGLSQAAADESFAEVEAALGDVSPAAMARLEAQWEFVGNPPKTIRSPFQMRRKTT